MSSRSLFSEFTREVRDAEEDFTIDGLVILDDDIAYAIAYDAAGSDYLLLEGKRGEEGICFEPVGPRLPFKAEAASIIARLAEGCDLGGALSAWMAAA